MDQVLTVSDISSAKPRETRPWWPIPAIFFLAFSIGISVWAAGAEEFAESFTIAAVALTIGLGMYAAAVLLAEEEAYLNGVRPDSPMAIFSRLFGRRWRLVKLLFACGVLFSVVLVGGIWTLSYPAILAALYLIPHAAR